MAKNSNHPIASRGARREGIVKDRPGYQGKVGGKHATHKAPRKAKRGRY